MAGQWRPALEQVKQQTVQTFTTLKGKLDIIIQRLNAHTGAIGNPHKTTAKDLDLENVPNIGLATDQEARDAVSNTTLMSPARTNAWAEDNVYGPIAKCFGDAADKL